MYPRYTSIQLKHSHAETAETVTLGVDAANDLMENRVFVASSAKLKRSHFLAFWNDLYRSFLALVVFSEAFTISISL